jgi:hypothetical protein
MLLTFIGGVIVGALLAVVCLVYWGSLDDQPTEDWG